MIYGTMKIPPVNSPRSNCLKNAAQPLTSPFDGGGNWPRGIFLTPDLHTAQSNSYNSTDKNDFMNKGDWNNNKSNKNQSGSEFYDNTSFNKSLDTEVSIDGVINAYSEPNKY